VPIGISITLTPAVVTAASIVAAVAVGTLLIDSVVESVSKSSENLPTSVPQETPLRTGQPGPGGGIIIDWRHNPDVLKCDLEVIPGYSSYTYPSGGVPPNWGAWDQYKPWDTWRLPTVDELSLIYYVQLVEERFPLEKIVIFADAGIDKTGFIWTSTESGPNSALALDLSVKQKDREKFGENFSSNSKNNTYSYVSVRELPASSANASVSGI
jgi:hypothetical protein